MCRGHHAWIWCSTSELDVQDRVHVHAARPARHISYKDEGERLDAAGVDAVRDELAYITEQERIDMIEAGGGR